MLDMGFIPDIEKICSLLPITRQTLLFSATMPPEIRHLTKKFLSNPKEIAVTPSASAAETVEQFYVKTTPRSKNATLEAIIKQEKVKNAFIFCNRKRDVDALSTWLKRRGHSAQAMHGDLAQSKRTETLDKFKNGEITLLVCSDVAARGIDVDNVSHVFNYNVPLNPDDYVHRIGRTGRAGQKGRAWMLVTKGDDKQLAAIEKRTGQSIPDAQISNDNQKDKPHSKTKDTNERSKSPKKNKTRPSKDHKHEEPDYQDITGFGKDVPAFFK